MSRTMHLHFPHPPLIPDPTADLRESLAPIYESDAVRGDARARSNMRAAAAAMRRVGVPETLLSAASDLVCV